MNHKVHHCARGSWDEISVVEESLIARGFVESDEGQSQKNIPPGEYVKVSLANVMHHRHGEIQYRIAWVEME